MLKIEPRLAAYPTLVPLLTAFRQGLADILAEGFVALYLGGSLALGGFELASSDIDFLAVTAQAVTDAQLTTLTGLHHRLDGINRFGAELEGSYVDAASVRTFGAAERRHPKRLHGHGATPALIGWDHREIARLDLWIMREHGIVLHGPDPKFLIDVIKPDEIRAIAQREIAAVEKFWTIEQLESAQPQYLFSLALKLCRALYTVQRGVLPTKQEALAWAQRELPDPWRRPLSSWQAAGAAISPAGARDFIRWAADYGLFCASETLRIMNKNANQL